jgi:Zn-dependent metalloprotease
MREGGLQMKAKGLGSTLLSIVIITSSFMPVLANQNNDNIHPKISSISGKNSVFVSGKLTEKSNESPEKIVEKSYNKKFSTDGNSKTTKQKRNKQFKKGKQFINSMGRTGVKTTQTYNGTPIFGTEQNYHINKEGVIECVVGSTVEDIDSKVASDQNSILTSEQDALDVIEKHLGFKPEYTGAPKFELVLYPSNDKYVYAYKVSIDYKKPSFGGYTYYVDAKNLSILSTFNHVASAEQAAKGSGIGQFGKVIQNLDIVYNDADSKYYLHNIDGKLEVMNHSRVVYSEPDSNFDSGTPTNYQQDAVDAYDNMQCILKYFKDTFNRDGNDDKGSKYQVYINDTNLDMNAYGSENYAEFLVGHGSGGGTRGTACCLDVAAHEFTHGMLEAEGLSYYETPGCTTEATSLHEGLATLLGSIVDSIGFLYIA